MSSLGAVLNIIYFIMRNISNKISTLIHIQIPLGSPLIIRLLVLLAVGHECVLIEFRTHLSCLLFWQWCCLGRWFIFRLFVVLIVLLILVIIKIVKIGIHIESTGGILG